MAELGWTRTDADIPTWDLNPDSSFYVEKWGLSSYAAYHNGTPVGTYGTREEAQAAAETEYLAGVACAPVEIISFGYGHGDPPPAHLTVDLREHFRDPHVDSSFRELTAEDERVGRAVTSTLGIPELIQALTYAVLAFRFSQAPVTLAVGCVGGRHRSAVVATILGQRLRREGIPVNLIHRDMHRPVIKRPAEGGGCTARGIAALRDRGQAALQAAAPAIGAVLDEATDAC